MNETLILRDFVDNNFTAAAGVHFRKEVLPGLLMMAEPSAISLYYKGTQREGYIKAIADYLKCSREELMTGQTSKLYYLNSNNTISKTWKR